jgi:hypothetical protein
MSEYSKCTGGEEIKFVKPISVCGRMTKRFRPFGAGESFLPLSAKGGPSGLLGFFENVIVCDYSGRVTNSARIYMKSNLKCSNCGAEITNLNFGWDRKQWVWFIPFVLFVLALPLIFDYMMSDRSDYRADLLIHIADKQFNEGTVEINGTIENHGNVEWEDIIVQAEMYSAENRLLDEMTRRVYTNLPPGATEHFQIQSDDCPEDRWNRTERIEIKVADARNSSRSIW